MFVASFLASLLAVGVVAAILAALIYVYRQRIANAMKDVVMNAPVVTTA